MIKVIYNGSVLRFKMSAENSLLVEQLREKSEQKCLRFEVRFGRVRTIYYYDYDKLKDPGETQTVADV